ncbi:MAG TPA: TadE/TadG family type IV pilus assembly protein [Stellaceae bacterium]|nr:TadE/TadG family type IV pilus assembly protein [Stellaceae bacterium]
MSPYWSFLRRVGRDNRGNVALFFGLMLTPLLFAVGGGIDYARGTQARVMLQSIVDSAAISGAAAYTAPSAQANATALAQAFVTKGTASLPSNITVKSTVITPGTIGSGNNVAYTMSVSISASMPTTLMGLFMRTMNVTVFAAAKNPVVTMTFDTTGFTSSACDANSLYWYVVPANGGVPNANTLNNVVWTNTSSSNPNTVSITVAASQQIGFAFKNVTGGRPSSLGGCNYGNNTYGSRNGDTQWFYSSLIPPNSQANTAPGGASTGTHGVYPTTQDCSMQVLQGTLRYGSWTYPSAPQQCFTATGSGDWGAKKTSVSWSQALLNAAPNCAALGGNSFQYAFNDMGGTSDDYDYNDLVFNLQCSGGSGAGTGTTTTGVILTD